MLWLAVAAAVWGSGIAVPLPRIAVGAGLLGLVWLAQERLRRFLLALLFAGVMAALVLVAAPAVRQPGWRQPLVVLHLSGEAVVQPVGGGRGYQLRVREAPTFRVAAGGVRSLGLVEVELSGPLPAKPTLGAGAVHEVAAGVGGEGTIRGRGGELYKLSQVAWVRSAGGFAAVTGRVRETFLAKVGVRGVFAGVFHAGERQTMPDGTTRTRITGAGFVPQR